ncbi:hypothetical protein THAOC_03823 [Thalassiosira oceanica]|uniref:MYND-type domain-containing protein n=1 Tax=Thalassiosira oceanica TaxID=159749 RepID=K0TBJ1_THAOC|nr:hypothetical protein THAOC_03823 [Thalassiosira oceanica]|eukprot:EJK74494.1 hypothetical protein THAOC_03823 [Thalassiosira oceanica]
MNEEAVEQPTDGSFLSFDTSKASGRAAFNIVKNSQPTDDYNLEGNCKQLDTQYTETEPSEWILELEEEDLMHRQSELQQMEDVDLLVHALNNMPSLSMTQWLMEWKEDWLVLPDSDPNKLTIKDLGDKLSGHYQRVRERDILNKRFQASKSPSPSPDDTKQEEDMTHGYRSRVLTSLLNLTMSCVPIGVPVVDDGNEVCANRGKTRTDTVKLKDCTACHLVKYCGMDCQRAHRKQHKKACKQRAAELKDEQLYSQGHERPEAPEGDFCPICTLPIPLPMDDHSGFMVCCMKRICNGCNVAAQERGMRDCAFCRTPYPDNDADTLAMIQARVAKKDPVAISHLGDKYCHGGLGLQKDMQKAVELWTEAAELGSVEALFNLGLAHVTGLGFEQDEAKGIHFWLKAAVQGHVNSRHNLGCNQVKKKNYGHAMRHFLISANMGHKVSVEYIKKIGIHGVR